METLGDFKLWEPGKNASSHANVPATEDGISKMIRELLHDIHTETPRILPSTTQPAYELEPDVEDVVLSRYSRPTPKPTPASPSGPRNPLRGWGTHGPLSSWRGLGLQE